MPNGLTTRPGRGACDREPPRFSLRSRALRWIVIAGLAALFVATVPAAASARTYFPDCTNDYEPVYKPKTVQVGCVAILRLAKKLRWDQWGSSRARGRGRYVYNTCDPTCVDGRVRRKRARIVLYRSRDCSYSNERVFTRMKVLAKGESRRPYKLRCQPL